MNRKSRFKKPIRLVFCGNGTYIVLETRPNRETLAAMKEAIELANDPNAKTFSSIEELRKDLEMDDEDEAD